MLELDFNEPETFITPDGSEYIINPLPIRHIKKVNNFIDLNTQLQEYQANNDEVMANKIIYGDDTTTDKDITLTSLCEELIDLSIKNIEDGSNLPKKYRTIFKMIELCGYIIQATINLPAGSIENIEGDGIPLETKRESLNTPEPVPTSSSKKPGGKQRKS